MNRSASLLLGRCLPWGLVGMLGLMIGIERQIHRLGPDLMNPHALDWRESGIAARTAACRCSVLCMGDSLVKLGVAPQVLEARLGRPVYNLAILSGYAPSTYFLLKRVLESGGRPEVIIVDGEKLIENPFVNPGLWAELVDLTESLDLLRTAGDPSFATRILLCQVLHSYRERFEIRGNLIGALRGESPSFRSINAVHQRNWAANAGAQFLEESAEKGLDDVLAGYHPGPWYCHTINAAYLRRFLSLASSHHIAIYWLLPPVTPPIQARRDESGLDRDYCLFLQALQKRCPNVTVVDARHSGYGQSAHADCVHLNASGAWVLSNDLAGVISRQTSAAAPARRWVALPNYREPGHGNPLETTVESRLVLRQQWERRHQ